MCIEPLANKRTSPSVHTVNPFHCNMFSFTESLIARSLILVATTLAAGRYMPPPGTSYSNPLGNVGDGGLNANATRVRSGANATCSLNDTCNTASTTSATISDCSLTDAMVNPDHFLAPLLVPCIAILLTHMPTLLLTSRARVLDLKAATSGVLLAWLCGLLVSWLSTVYGRSFAYAMSLHASVHLLAQPASHTLIAGAWADRTVKRACTVVVLVCAWQLGPPLPVLDAPGIPRCCGTASHLAGFILPDIAAPIAFGLVGWIAALGD